MRRNRNALTHVFRASPATEVERSLSCLGNTTRQFRLSLSNLCCPSLTSFSNLSGSSAGCLATSSQVFARPPVQQNLTRQPHSSSQMLAAFVHKESESVTLREIYRRDRSKNSQNSAGAAEPVGVTCPAGGGAPNPKEKPPTPGALVAAGLDAEGAPKLNCEEVAGAAGGAVDASWVPKLNGEVAAD